MKTLPKGDAQFYLYYALTYRAEARADLYSEYGVSLAELISQGRLTELADLLSQLPQASRFWSAMSDDESYTEMVLEAHLSQDEEDVPMWAPSQRDYTANYQLLAQIYDAVQAVNYTTAAVQGAKGLKKPKPFPAPRTGIDKAKARMARDQSNDLFEKFGRAAPDWDTRVRTTDT